MWLVPGTEKRFETRGYRTDFQKGQRFGSLQLGEKALYVKHILRCYVIPYPEIGRAYRRVMRVPRGKNGSVDFECLVVEDQQGKELAQVMLRGREEAQGIMQFLQPRLPWASFHCPNRPQSKEGGADSFRRGR